jgi:hypothetical protein
VTIPTLDNGQAGQGTSAAVTRVLSLRLHSELFTGTAGGAAFRVICVFRARSERLILDL